MDICTHAGKNNYGQVGIGNTANVQTILRAEKEVIELSCAGEESAIRKIDEQIYVTGLNTTGQLGTGTKTNVTTYTKIIPAGIEISQIRHIKARTTGLIILLENGDVYVCRKQYKWRIRNKE